MQGTDKLTHIFVLHLVKTQLNLYNGHIEVAKKTFIDAEPLLEISKGISIFHTHYLLVKIRLGLAMAKKQRNAGENTGKEIRELLKTSKKLISKSKKMVGNLTEAYILRANIFLFNQKFKKAFKNLQLAIATGEKYNGRLELSRACFETGKFLADPNNKYNELNGHPAGYYLDKAKAMFEEMDLQWDL